VADLNEKIEELKAGNQHENTTVLLQLNDDSVYQAGGLGGTRHLLRAGKHGDYHVSGTLLVADKGAGIRKMTSLLYPLVKARR
jgi:hypothetical protein